jgi:hypothetical protein
MEVVVMFEIVSDSPYISKRTPITGEQVKSTYKAVTIGKKPETRPNKPKPKQEDKSK